MVGELVGAGHLGMVAVAVVALIVWLTARDSAGLYRRPPPPRPVERNLGAGFRDR